MDNRLTKIEAIIPTLATREDLARLETRMEGAIHREINTLTWRLMIFVVTLLPTLFAAVFYVARNVH
jgi:hypothetical protein